ncbi:MAG TPA: class I SAM-dependent RNA methyltransferase [Gemmatimonadaceae bacterium]|nr:class I SAM-dependent RNA methyltransferase [Gemmatimonadaceae bacterium]
MTARNALELFAVTAPGIEAITATELGALGVQCTVESGGISFTGQLANLYAANLHLRTASRILLRLGHFQATAFHELERNARKLVWGRTIAAGDSVRVRVTCRKSRLYHSDAVAERILAAIDRSVGGVTALPGGGDDDATDATLASVESEGRDPGPLVVVRIVHDRVIVSADTSGALLHLRGYRQAIGKAPLRETLAAAMLLASGWDPATPLVDPMCGSGTIAIEGALLARRLAPGLGRRFAFQRWPDFDASVWDALVERAQAMSLAATPAPIVAMDRDAGAVAATSANAGRAGVAPDVEAACAPLSDARPPNAAGGRPGAIVTNPPYGARLGDRRALRDLYARLGQVCRAGFPGWIVALLSADRRLESQLRLDLAERFRTYNGGIPVRLLAGPIPG